MVWWNLSAFTGQHVQTRTSWISNFLLIIWRNACIVYIYNTLSSALHDVSHKHLVLACGAVRMQVPVFDCASGNALREQGLVWVRAFTSAALKEKGNFFARCVRELCSSFVYKLWYRYYSPPIARAIPASSLPPSLFLRFSSEILLKFSFPPKSSWRFRKILLAKA